MEHNIQKSHTHTQTHTRTTKQQYNKIQGFLG